MQGRTGQEMEEEKQKPNGQETVSSDENQSSGVDRILKRGILNYLRSLKYFFTPIGTLAIGIVFGFSGLISGTVEAISELAHRMTEISQVASVDLMPIQSRLTQAIGTLNWNQPTKALQTAFTTEWLPEAWKESVASCEGLNDSVREEIGEAVDRCASQLTGYMYLFVLLAWLGLVAGYLITKWQIRRNLAKRVFWKALMVSALNALLGATVVAFCARMLVISGASALLSFLISLILWGFISLFEAYLVHGWKKVGFRQTVNFKTVGLLLLTNLLIFLFAVGTAALVFWLVNRMVGIFVGIATVEIAYIVSSLNAEAFMKELAEEPTAEEPTENSMP